MPPYLPAEDDATIAGHRRRHRHGRADAAANHPPKQNQTILSILLKPFIMLLITSLFFLFLGFAALVLLHLCLAGGFFHRRRATLRQFPPPQCPNPALSSRDLRKLPTFEHPGWLRDHIHKAICAVCLDDFRRGQGCRELPGCGHVFHRSCVDSWLVKVAACPVCRSRVCADPDSSASCTDNKLRFWSFSGATN